MGPSFLDPQTMSNGQPYGPYRFKQIIKELYIISKNTYTPYTDLLDVSPTERTELLNLIIEDTKRSEEAMQKIKAETKKKRESRRG